MRVVAESKGTLSVDFVSTGTVRKVTLSTGNLRVNTSRVSTVALSTGILRVNTISPVQDDDCREYVYSEVGLNEYRYFEGRKYRFSEDGCYICKLKPAQYI
jgi:hypothetical protein